MTVTTALSLGQHPADWPIARLARCADPRGSYTALFFSVDADDVARAKAICARCTVREPCLQQAIERGEPAGVWGGECFEGGAIVPAPRRRGRPPRVARPVFVDEITGRQVAEAP